MTCRQFRCLLIKTCGKTTGESHPRRLGGGLPRGFLGTDIYIFFAKHFSLLADASKIYEKKQDYKDKNDNLNHQRLEEDAVLVALLKNCGKCKDLTKGIRIHAQIRRRGLLERNSHALVEMYAKCGALAEAQQVSGEMSIRTVPCWNALIGGYAGNGQYEDALRCFKQMQAEGLAPNSVTFNWLLKACGRTGALEKGKHVHEEIAKQGLLVNNILLGNAVVNMYIKCGSLANAQQVFDELIDRDVASWTGLMAGYVQCGQGEKALNYLPRMQHEGISANEVTFCALIKACGTLGAIEKGKQLHVELREGLDEINVLLGNALVDMYTKCSMLVKAQQVHDELVVHDVTGWTILIEGYAQHAQAGKALECFEQMQKEAVSPDALMFTCFLKACGNIRAVQKGKEIHARVLTGGFLRSDVLLGNALIDMYAKCGRIFRAQQVLNDLPSWTVASWTALITGYAQHGHSAEALNCYERMQREGFSPNAITYVSILKACIDIEKGKEIHSQLVGEGLLEENILVGNAIVDMYAKCGALAKALAVLDELPVQDVVSWTALIAGYTQHGQPLKAIDCFERMQCEGILPDASILACILKACGDMEKSIKVNSQITRGMLEENTLLGTALMDMYAKCGDLAGAQEVFNELPNKNSFHYNAWMTACSRFGEGDAVFSLFNKMLGEGIKPDQATFSILLNACSHLGLVDKGQKYFLTMATDFDIVPTSEHEACMIDLLGRTGHLDKALALFNKMQLLDHLPSWSALLGACQKWANVKLGRLAFEHAIQLDEKYVPSYASMGNIYLAAGMHEAADMIEAMRVRKAAHKMAAMRTTENI